ncbi:MAG: selenocysteine-specific translation elongation factor [Desulfovibrionaceae bacterium]
MSIILGTAGHVDHGKTTLVKALSGIDCDTLTEEKRRGITIELGFAKLSLPNGTEVSIIDMPGHEKFVKNMVSGASGIDAVLFTISAEEGIMPQTKEHLEITSLLQINKGMILLTKIDLVDKEWLSFVIEEVSALFSTSILCNAPIFPVSSYTGEGLDSVRDYIIFLEKTATKKPNSFPFRMPIDRVFTIKGHGTVVTGTSISGTLAIGDSLQIYPQKIATRARGIQRHRENSSGLAGQRIALNIHNIEVKNIHKGDTISLPEMLQNSREWEVWLHCLPSSPITIKNRVQIHFHHYTKEVLARVYFLDRQELQAGESTIAIIRFDEDMVGIAKDSFIIRSYSPLRTIAGGHITNPLAKQNSFFSKKTYSEEKAQDLAFMETKEEFEYAVKERLLFVKELGLSLLELTLLFATPEKTMEENMTKLINEKKVILFDKEKKIYCHTQIFENIKKEYVETLLLLHKTFPLKKGFSRNELLTKRTQTESISLGQNIIDSLIKEALIIQDGTTLREQHHTVNITQKEQELETNILSLYKEAGLTPPTVKEVSESFTISLKELRPIMKHMQENAILVKISEDIWYEKNVLDTIKADVKLFFTSAEQLTISDLKSMTNGLSRKYLVPLLEHFDTIRLTIRKDTYRTAHILEQ